MKTYWDLSERERAALTREDVEKFLDAELMVKGVLASAALELVPVPTVELRRVEMYTLDNSYGSVGAPVAFRTEEDIRTFLSLNASAIDHDWQLDSKLAIAKPIPNDGEIRTISLATRQSVEAAKLTLKAIKAATEENERRKRAHEEAQHKVESALGGLWEDWYACQEKAYRVSKVVETFEKYVKLADGETVAAKFLAQAFTPPQIEEAEEWTQRRMTHPEAAVV